MIFCTTAMILFYIVPVMSGFQLMRGYYVPEDTCLCWCPGHHFFQSIFKMNMTEGCHRVPQNETLKPHG
jgi:hypothetical protein